MEYSILVSHLKECGFDAKANKYRKNNKIAIGSVNVTVDFIVSLDPVKCEFAVDLTSPAFIIHSTLEKDIDSIITIDLINVIFEDLIKSSFEQYTKDIVNKVLPIEK